MRSTKIVATLGPASNDADTLEQMVAAGLDVARLNFAHGDAEEHAGRVERLRAAAERVGREVAILCDIPGPKLRIGPMAGGHAELHTGRRWSSPPSRWRARPSGCPSTGRACPSS